MAKTLRIFSLDNFIQVKLKVPRFLVGSSNFLTLGQYRLLNLFSFKLLWFILVIFQNRAAIPALIILIILNVCHPEKRLAWKTFFLISVVGVCTDSLLSISGVFIFDQSLPFLPIPLWLLLLWFAFAMTLPYGFAFVSKSSPLIQALIGAAASFSYLIGMNLGAVTYGYPLLITQCILIGIWSLLIPLYFNLIHQERYSVILK